MIKKLPLVFLLSLIVFWPAKAGQQQHGVTLTWTASTSPNVTYNMYRAISGGPYTKVNAQPISGLTFFDGTGGAGTQYFYVATAVDSSGVESKLSNEVSASFLVLPGPPVALKATVN